MCVCVCARARARVCVCVCACVRAGVRACVVCTKTSTDTEASSSFESASSFARRVSSSSLLTDTRRSPVSISCCDSARCSQRPAWCQCSCIEDLGLLGSQRSASCQRLLSSSVLGSAPATHAPAQRSAAAGAHHNLPAMRPPPPEPPCTQAATRGQTR